MSEAPKKIWLADLGYKYEVWFDSVGSDLCTPYIRADIVDELLKVLIAIGAGQVDPKAVAIQALENYMEEK